MNRNDNRLLLTLIGKQKNTAFRYVSSMVLSHSRNFIMQNWNS
nr:MAG TPA: Holliday junction recognition protein-associated repeat [Caudoviricetes sp.]